MPTLLDLGVAMAAGAAAAFAYSRKSITNSIAGVAIAVALVPPLAVTGVGLALGRRASADVGLSLSEIGLYSGGTDIASGAFILFLTNLAGIILVAGAVLVAQRYGDWRRASLGLFLVAVVSMLLMEPLGESLHRLVVKSRTIRMIATLPTVRPDLFDGRGRIDSLNVTYRDDCSTSISTASCPETTSPGCRKRSTFYSNTYRSRWRADRHRGGRYPIGFVSFRSSALEK